MLFRSIVVALKINLEIHIRACSYVLYLSVNSIVSIIIHKSCADEPLTVILFSVIH